ncbi:ABC transporter substrate-binding protein [Curvibacter sp. PAE-UM]|uniref:ABC transporter substrate-binding protein n=1 Tax=Curvibacter sp. PAE-UM TaxID=1714344 RepID=UPI00070D7EE8|nr:ABC transporter substrate-binding protein [Curvibacter sp. PAE-UM]KRI01395.1 nitrate ABC transporter substrate-binding protein [Curvibacter sp. PAE-UM]
MKRHFLRTFAALALGALCTGAWAQAKLDKVTIAGWGGPISEITNLLVEPDKGFFRAQGIAMVFMPGTGGGDAVRNLLSGQADVAFTDPGSLYAALDKGEKLRVIYDIYPQNIFNVVALKSRGISKPADLKGKKIGVYSLSSGTLTNLQLLLNQAGLSEKDVTIVVTGLLNFAPLMQGQVDATAATDTGLLVARARGVGEVNVMEVRNSLNVSSDIFVVREETYQQKKDVLKRFLAAYRDSMQWMINNPQEAAALAVKRAINGQNETVNLEVIKLRNLSSVSPLTQKNGLGAIDVDMLQKGADAWKKIGLVQRDLKMKDVVSADLLPGK